MKRREKMENKTTAKPEEWPELVAFAAAMRVRLEVKAPEWGKGWKKSSPELLLEYLNGHVYWLEEAVYHCDFAAIMKKTVDVANLAMMMFDVAAAEMKKVRACRVCGCTDDHACPGGCSWVVDPKGGNLCSRCV
jgi:hypothetical protein